MPTPDTTALFTYYPQTGFTPLTVDFTNASTAITPTYDWDFGDTTHSSDENPSHTYMVLAPTDFTVMETVTGDDGTDSTSATVHVNVPAPEAAYTYAPHSGITPLTVDFTNASTGIISSYLWNFGDGTTGGHDSPSHTYVVTTPTDFTSTLVATGPGGDSTASAVVHVGVAAPVAGFTYTPHAGNSPLTVTFTNTSTGLISTYGWTFGDGGTSSSASPSHIYIDTITVDQTATLTVTGPGGSNSTSAVVHIGGVAAPVITSNPSSMTVEAGSDLILNVVAVGVDLTYSWFKNGVAMAGQTSPVFSKNAVASDAGAYQCQVSNAEGTVTSTIAIVTVQDPLDLLKIMGRTETNKIGRILTRRNGSVIFGDMASYPGN